eukprot:766476-Hanusia_phi.AAC.3
MSLNASSDSLRSFQLDRKKGQKPLKCRSEKDMSCNLSASLTDRNCKPMKKSLHRRMQAIDCGTQTCEFLLNNYISERFKDFAQRQDQSSHPETAHKEGDGKAVNTQQLKSILKSRQGKIDESFEVMDLSSALEETFSADSSLILDESFEALETNLDYAANDLSRLQTDNKKESNNSLQPKMVRAKGSDNVKRESSKTLLNSTVSSRYDGLEYPCDALIRLRGGKLARATTASRRHESKFEGGRQKSVKWNQEIVKVLEYSAGAERYAGGVCDPEKRREEKRREERRGEERKGEERRGEERRGEVISRAEQRRAERRGEDKKRGDEKRGEERRGEDKVEEAGQGRAGQGRAAERSKREGAEGHSRSMTVISVLQTNQ